MKLYTIRISYTDRKFGPGTGQSFRIKAGSFHTAIKTAVRMFWSLTRHKEHNDIRRDGLKVEAREVPVDKASE